MAAFHVGTTLPYEQDNGDTTVGLVWHVNDDDTVNLTVYDPANGTWTNANSVPTDSPRIKL